MAAHVSEADQFRSFQEKSAARSRALKDKWTTKRAEQVVVEEETPARFWAAFTPDAKALAAEAERAADAAAVRDLELRGQVLRDRAAAASGYLKAYDIKRATAEAQAAADAIAAAKDRLVPKSKFGFKKGSFKFGKPAAAPAPAPKAPEVRATPAAQQMPGARGKRGEVVVLGEDVGAQATLEDLEDCVVFVDRPLNALRLVRMARCRVYARSVAGPCYVYNCEGCEVRCAPRQLRIHETTATTFHVSCASGPIIEDCDGLRFAPYCCAWATPLDLPFAVKDGAWKDVKDFKWLKKEASPHWALLDAAAYAAAVPENAAAEAAARGLRLLPAADA